ncbi:CrfX protein [Pseudomonas sp. gcc21]|uniref:CrfX protein n=1 Tax=Pseudomonas sp. gcc21 TaxID=2726989 RepID=UPI001451FAA2|nr:CrfX protein [Pseudomonas sp. gcc21]QJD58327.1 CrfX protein [Pseudomonas sp. gcc21]
MDDPFENQLRNLMRDAEHQRPVSSDNERLERVLHKAHIHGGIFDLLSLFARWGWVLTEGINKGIQHGRPVRRSNDSSKQASE